MVANWQEFQKFCNETTIGGYLKPWKAESIIAMISCDPGWLKPKTLLSYIYSCLLMEGFSESEVSRITDWILIKANKETPHE